MQISVQKEKPKYKSRDDANIAAGEQITCGACGHVRESNANNPAWQCPKCKAAYSKVSKEGARKRRKGWADRVRESAEYKRLKQYQQRDSFQWSKDQWAKMGAWLGSASIVAGMAKKTCAGLITPSNPILLGIGAALALDSIAYLIFQWLS